MGLRNDHVVTHAEWYRHVPADSTHSQRERRCFVAGCGGRPCWVSEDAEVGEVSIVSLIVSASPANESAEAYDGAGPSLRAGHQAAATDGRSSEQARSRGRCRSAALVRQERHKNEWHYGSS